VHFLKYTFLHFYSSDFFIVLKFKNESKHIRTIEVSFFTFSFFNHILAKFFLLFFSFYLFTVLIGSKQRQKIVCFRFCFCLMIVFKHLTLECLPTGTSFAMKSRKQTYFFFFFATKRQHFIFNSKLLTSAALKSTPTWNNWLHWNSNLRFIGKFIVGQKY